MRGFQSTITFACTGGLPSGATCLFTPSSVAITSSAAATTTLTIALVASGGEIPDTQASTHPAVVSVGGGVTLAGLILLVIPRRYHGFTRLRRLLVVLVALSPFAFITGCGSGVTQSSTAGQSAITTGAYTVIVTASGGSATQATTVKLTVQ